MIFKLYKKIARHVGERLVKGFFEKYYSVVFSILSPAALAISAQR